MRPLEKPSHKAKLDVAFHADVSWWLSFLQGHCERNLVDCRPKVYLFTDACDTGAGMVAPSDWAYLNWEADMPHVTTEHINVKETLVALMALYRWAPLLRDSHVVIFMDNVTTRAVFNKGACHQPRIMDHMRCVYWLAQRFNFKVTAEHLPGGDNTVADSISCMSSLPHAQFIFSLASQASPPSPSAFAYCCHPHMSLKSLHCLLQAHHWDLPLIPQLPPSAAMP